MANEQTGRQRWLQKPVLAIVVISVIAGGAAGAGATVVIDKNLSLGRNRSQQVVIEESSAIINVAKKLEPSVVSITTQDTQLDIFGRPSSSTGAGSGLIIQQDGLILTNKHVLPEGATKITVTTNDNKDYDGTVLARDPFNDLAYVKINASGLAAAPLGDSDQVVVGQKVVAIGNALGEFQNTVTSGIISGIGRPVEAGDAGSDQTEQLQDLFQTDAAINPGNSGGPLVNIDGEVIGLNTAIADQAQNIGFSIPINQAKSGIASIEKQGKLVKPYLGVRYVNIDKDVAKANNLAATSGAWITSDAANSAIVPDSPAAKAGLKDKDIITKVNSDSIASGHSLVSLVGKYNVGDKLTLTVLRDGKTITVDLTLEAAPQT